MNPTGKPRRTPTALNAVELSTVARVTPNRRADWAKQGLLRPGPTFGALDAAEASALRTLVGAVGPKRGKESWAVVRGSFRSALATRPRRVWVVVDLELREHELCTTAREVCESAVIGRPVQVVPLAGELKDAQKRFQAAAPRVDQPGTVERLDESGRQ